MKKSLVPLVLLSICMSFGAELDKLVEFALKNNPGLRSYESLKRSFFYKKEFSLSLPNPQVGVGLNNLDTREVLPRRENPMSGFALFVSQKYILPVKRERSAEIYGQKAGQVDVREESYRKELVKQLKELYWEFSYSFEMERILRDVEREIRALMEITEERYRYGKALLSDLILLRVELLKVEELLAQALRLRETTLSRIHALAGGEIELEGSELEVLPFPESFDPERNVQVKLLLEDLKVLRREIERAKVEHYPDVFLSASYTVRPEIPNLFTFRVGLTVPVWKGRREDLLVLEKEEVYRSKLFELENVKLRVSGEFSALKSSYRITSRILSTVEREIEEKEKEISALLIAYEYERTDIRDILRAYRLLWSLEFDRARLVKELNQTVAKAEALQ